MTRNNSLRWALLVAANVAVWCVLSLHQSQGANNQLPANNRVFVPGGPDATQQRAEIINQLRDIKTSVNILVQYRRNEALPQADPIQP